ncbi:MAG: bifunctional diaminohydroxyphosphoribosylaminopyrimidine deaminase/5-amino-6-(5-phosphoribosylamino)uracil reductase RibD [Alphaproteobacteria bacterium]|nr:bifunctional diaminohydroxyphosphoribosylaminopyrimidine deaminase/5-amino-6-(5-phosphoribosylamino)uracil reductase RibD [Alphaproteobacteria bacterium]
MRAALGLAARNLGRTWPNPAVGCVLVREGRVVGRGATAVGGRPHAEAVALGLAGSAARGATAYVTLEPCAHHGRAGPCSDALIAAGIERLVAAIEDPDPRTAGDGFARLRAAGVVVEVGIEADAARRLAEGFLRRIADGRPMVTLKLATSLDGRIATHRGDSRWITGEAARTRVQALRATHDAVMVGTGTALADDPELTCRLPGAEAPPAVRVVLDRHLRIPLTHKLVRTADRTPTWIATSRRAEAARAAAMRAAGVELIEVEEAGEGLDLRATLRALAGRGLTRVLCEGGGHLAAGLLRDDLVDHLVCFRAGLAIGGDGRPALAGFGVDGLADAPRLQRRAQEPCGGDIMELWARASPLNPS